MAQAILEVACIFDITADRIKEVFSASVRVESHPATGVPHIVVIPKGSAIKQP